jgi:hypothetical protein
MKQMKRTIKNMRIFKLKIYKSPLLLLAILFMTNGLLAQDGTNPDGTQNIISSSVAFLNISPESRAGGMGDAGVATSPDLISQHWNPAKYAFIEGSMGAAFSFTPWLRNLVNDINMYYLSYYYRLDKMQTISASLRYFSLGDMNFTDQDNRFQFAAKPNQFALDAGYARVLSDHFSGAVAFRYIRSDLFNGYSSTGEQVYAGNSFAADIAFYYKNSFKVNRKESELSAGINISNIGSKITYDKVNKEFIPTNLKLGVAYKTEMDSYNDIMFTVDINKLLIPTPQRASENIDDYNDANEGVSVPAAIFKSFSDAPGGMEEEAQEVRISAGAEYWYSKQFALRVGYHHEHENKGNRKYITAGTGLKFNIFDIDASYIIPMQANNPLANTIRFTLGFDLSEMGGNR